MNSHYRKLALALAINTVVMYFVMYVMIASVDHFHFNINQLYMTLMMVAPMTIVMLVVMRSMYPNRKRNAVIGVLSVGVLLACFVLVRAQAPVGNQEFLRSMIPHHSGAILMCNEASITDREIIDLCGRIVKAQEEEIAEMERILARY